MIAYFKCRCGTKNKRLMDMYYKLGYRISIVRLRSERQKITDEYKINFPFVVENGEAKKI